jgi:hypothetical protein
MADSFRRFVASRLSWLDLTQADLAEIVAMDKSVLSRSLRASRPRQGTVNRILHGLGFPGMKLDDVENRGSSMATLSHPADLVPDLLLITSKQDRYRSWFGSTWDHGTRQDEDLQQDGAVGA